MPPSLHVPVCLGLVRRHGNADVAHESGDSQLIAVANVVNA